MIPARWPPRAATYIADRFEMEVILQINSWDLFDTLVAGRDISTPCGDLPEGNHFPILENVLKVMCDDVIVSDYYDSPKAHRILSNIAKLTNKLHVGNGIKSTGEIWRQVDAAHHTGDRPYEIESALRAGIGATRTRLSLFTPVEHELYEAGLKGLSLSIREARLVSYDGKYRQFQLLQNQTNFPFLFLASILLHRKLIIEGFNRVLMCSRDAFLWNHLQPRVRNLHHNASYDVHYFYTSRLTRCLPSRHVLQYTRTMVTSETLIVDVCGGGDSLKIFCDHMTLKPSVWLLVGYTNTERRLFPQIPYGIDSSGATTVELANLARHPMVCDMTLNLDDEFVPLFVNAANVDWESIPEIHVMHDAFALVMAVMPNYDFSSDLRIDNLTLMTMLGKALKRIEDAKDLLTAFAGSFFGAEEGNTRRVLRNIWPARHSATTRRSR